MDPNLCLYYLIFCGHLCVIPVSGPSDLEVQGLGGAIAPLQILAQKEAKSSLSKCLVLLIAPTYFQTFLQPLCLIKMKTLVYLQSRCYKISLLLRLQLLQKVVASKIIMALFLNFQRSLLTRNSINSRQEPINWRTGINNFPGLKLYPAMFSHSFLFSND